MATISCYLKVDGGSIPPRQHARRDLPDRRWPTTAIGLSEDSITRRGISKTLLTESDARVPGFVAEMCASNVVDALSPPL